MCFHVRLGSRQEDSRKKRNELAGMMLNIREQTTSFEMKEKLLALEKLLMESVPNACGAKTYGAELAQLLYDFPAVLNKGISQITENYLDRMRDRITCWQRQSAMEGAVKMHWKLFGRKKAKETDMSLKRQKCEKDIFFLEQKNTELAMRIEQLEKEKRDLMLEAAKCEPGSQGYYLIKQKYVRKESDVNAAAAHKALVQKALDSNYGYLNIMDTGRNLQELEGLMPPSPEEIELEVEKNIEAKSNMIDEFDRAQEIMRYGNTQIQDISREASGSSLSDPFDTAVNELREADHGYRAILGQESSLVDELLAPNKDRAANDRIKEEKL
jgi:hypothetical protein